MAGKLVVGTVSSGASTFEIDAIAKGLVKAWVNFDGTSSPIIIRRSLNVTSITDNGTGNYTVNFTTPMESADYVTALSSYYGTANTMRQSMLKHNGQSLASLNVVNVFVAANNGATLYDTEFAQVAVIAP